MSRGPFPESGIVVGTLTPWVDVAYGGPTSTELFEVWDASHEHKLTSGGYQNGFPGEYRPRRDGWRVPAGVLVDGGDYSWRNQRNGGDWTAWQELSVDLQNGEPEPSADGIQPPPDLVAQTADGGAYLSWNEAYPGAGTTLVGYAIEAWADGSAVATKVVDGATTATVMSGLTNGRTYTYRVIAFNDWDWSSPAEVTGVAATVSPLAPADAQQNRSGIPRRARAVAHRGSHGRWFSISAKSEAQRHSARADFQGKRGVVPPDVPAAVRPPVHRLHTGAERGSRLAIRQLRLFGGPPRRCRRGIHLEVGRCGGQSGGIDRLSQRSVRLHLPS
jgi:hypothetical protein